MRLKVIFLKFQYSLKDNCQGAITPDLIRVKKKKKKPFDCCFIAIKPNNTNSICIYIYIYIDRYRERERDTMREEREGVSTYSEVEACRTQPS